MRFADLFQVPERGTQATFRLDVQVKELRLIQLFQGAVELAAKFDNVVGKCLTLQGRGLNARSVFLEFLITQALYLKHFVVDISNYFRLFSS